MNQKKVKISDFKPNSIDENAQIYADLLPDGYALKAKNISTSNLRKLLVGFAGEAYRVQDKIYEFVYEYVIQNTTKFIDEWEKSVGIPDNCFTKNQNIETRRNQVMAKLGKMNIQVAEDYIALAKSFGYDLKINRHLYEKNNSFPLAFPIRFTTNKIFKFTVEFEFTNIPATVGGFPLSFPIRFGTTNSLMICLFNKIKDANIKIIYRNSG